jgi:negative regulator of flagellin synthesis FlgM
MKVNHPVSGPSQVHAAQVARAAGAQPDKPVEAVRRADSVHISPEGRTLSELATGEAADAELTPEQIATIRQRIQEGAYDSLEVVDALARRILARGDLEHGS